MAELDKPVEAVVGGQGYPLSDVRNLLRSMEAKFAAE
jgi:hypothetical protein